MTLSLAELVGIVCAAVWVGVAVIGLLLADWPVRRDDGTAE